MRIVEVNVAFMTALRRHRWARLGLHREYGLKAGDRVIVRSPLQDEVVELVDGPRKVSHVFDMWRIDVVQP